nr:MAG TPA: hypothetical protein [Caudoviricetes sp.]
MLNLRRLWIITVRSCCVGYTRMMINLSLSLRKII